MKNAVYFQSGGPTTVINSSFYGVIKEIYKHKDKIKNLYVSKFGVKGLINNDLVLINKPLESYKELLRKNGAICGTARVLLDENDESFNKIVENIKKNNIGYIFVNGGNDSMDTANKIKNYLKKINYECVVVGIPKSVDNDLANTDFVPGYPSTCKYINEVVKGVYQDAASYDEKRVNIIQVLCRNSGWLVASTKLADLCDMGPDLIYLPEVPFNIDEFLKDVKTLHDKQGNVLVCVAESLVDKNGKFIAPVVDKDPFGHEYFGSIGEHLSNLIKVKLGYKSRCLQLGIIERDIAPLNSSLDTKIAIQCGVQAVKNALKKVNGMVTIVRDNSDPYKYHLSVSDFENVANEEKMFPIKWINKKGNNITQGYIDYAKPFIDFEKTKVKKDIL